MSSSLVYVALLLHGAVAGESPTYCVVRGSQKVLLTDTCRRRTHTLQSSLCMVPYGAVSMVQLVIETYSYTPKSSYGADL